MQAEQNKDPTERQMTKIAREAAKFTVQMMKADGIGTAEFDFIHLVRHNPGMTQADVRAALLAGPVICLRSIKKEIG